MKFGFIDIVYAYTADRPEQNEPLGGTTSAICFLARALTTQGIECTFFNRINTPKVCHGIQSLPLSSLSDVSLYSDYSCFIFCGRWMNDIVQWVRVNTSVPLIAWMHESIFTPPLTTALDAFDAVVFVSHWQQSINQKEIRPHWQQHVIHNAMNPLAAELILSRETRSRKKTKPPCLLYAGSFARGAFHIAPILDRLRSYNSDFTIDVFCSTTPSGHEKSDQDYIEWLRRQQNVTHVGLVGQTQLMHLMEQASIMVAPNPWPETSCIAMIEAMATGLKVISTNRAALPETASGFATLIEIDDPDNPHRFDAPINYEIFAQKIASVLDVLKTDPISFEDEQNQQTKYFLNNYQWYQRVDTWVNFIEILRQT